MPTRAVGKLNDHRRGFHDLQLRFHGHPIARFAEKADGSIPTGLWMVPKGLADQRTKLPLTTTPFTRGAVPRRRRAVLVETTAEQMESAICEPVVTKAALVPE